MQEPNTEVGSEFSQMSGVLMNSLIGIEADFSYPDDPGRPLIAHPVADQVEGRCLTQFQANDLVEPGLGHVQSQQHRSKLKEDQELVKEHIKLAVADGIVEGLIPRIESDLHVDSHDYHKDQPGTQGIE